MGIGDLDPSRLVNSSIERKLGSFNQVKGDGIFETSTGVGLSQKSVYAKSVSKRALTLIGSGYGTNQVLYVRPRDQLQHPYCSYSRR